MLDDDALGRHLCRERVGPSAEEGLAARVDGEHGRRRGAGEGAHIQDQTLFADKAVCGEQRAAAMGEGGKGDIPGDHGRRDEAGDAQRGDHVDVDNFSEFVRGRVDKVCGDLVGYANVVNCWGQPERKAKQHQQKKTQPFLSLKGKGGITHRARRLRWI